MRVRRRTSTADGGAGTPYVDAARLARLVTPAPRHSGAPDITVAQWAILARCRMPHWVPVEDIMRSAIDWFTPPLSIGEVVHAIGVLAGQGWIRFDEVRQSAMATATGWSLIERFERPLGLADVWGAFAGAIGADLNDVTVCRADPHHTRAGDTHTDTGGNTSNA